ncbi:MAG TPA: D-hexose-6-phosphate mutarotase [Candidatus Competibacteraceae bacterium]|nr:D-hexose-6-phosphate mutarotase [Candidatus Competibacteraceae bacterium]
MTPISLHAADGSSCTAYNHGAQLTSWITPDGIERLYLSPRAEFGPGKAIRGGVPVIFPQFAGLGPLPRHGFARTHAWRRERAEVNSDGRIHLRYALHDDEHTRALWPYAFECLLDIAGSGYELELTLSVHNSGGTSFAFTVALHSYFRVTDIARAGITGLAGLTYRDSAAAGAMGQESAERLTFAGEVDRLYLEVRKPLRLETGRDVLEIEQGGFRDVVVWNPGPAKGVLLTDLEPAGWHRFVCIEAAQVEQPVILAPGARWHGWQRVRVPR